MDDWRREWKRRKGRVLRKRIEGIQLGEGISLGGEEGRKGGSESMWRKKRQKKKKKKERAKESFIFVLVIFFW